MELIKEEVEHLVIHRIAGHGAWPAQYKDDIATWDQSLQDDADLRERSPLYVAMTRARDELVVLSPV